MESPCGIFKIFKNLYKILKDIRIFQGYLWNLRKILNDDLTNVYMYKHLGNGLIKDPCKLLQGIHYHISQKFFAKASQDLKDPRGSLQKSWGPLQDNLSRILQEPQRSSGIINEVPYRSFRSSYRSLKILEIIFLQGTTQVDMSNRSRRSNQQHFRGKTDRQQERLHSK